MNMNYGDEKGTQQEEQGRKVTKILLQATAVQRSKR
jgi:hypothetical protein